MQEGVEWGEGGGGCVARGRGGGQRGMENLRTSSPLHVGRHCHWC